jgi:hypothetical protein
MPTANGAKPKLPKEKYPKVVKDMLAKIRQFDANPNTPHK